MTKINYKIIGKYIKNLNFSIPSSKSFFLLSKNISNYKINIDIKSNQVDKNIIEIILTLSLTPIKDDFEKINSKIEFSTIVQLTDSSISKNEIEKIVLISVPTEVYAELRKIFISLFENSGFRDVKINETVDFEKLYNLNRIQ
tara:strand:- start:527 stop:955 length:429 start_codon:yes stop_codon:yes gene_type:complete